MAKIEVITGVERQRRWSNEEKLRILSQAYAVGGLPPKKCNRPVRVFLGYSKAAVHVVEFV